MIRKKALKGRILKGIVANRKGTILQKPRTGVVDPHEAMALKRMYDQGR
jgi:hypothetical protein